MQSKWTNVNLIDLLFVHTAKNYIFIQTVLQIKNNHNNHDNAYDISWHYSMT